MTSHGYTVHRTGRAIMLLAAAVALALGGCAGGPGARDTAPTVARFFIEDDTSAMMATLPHSGVTIAIAAKPVLTEFDLAKVEVAQVELGRCLRFQLTPAASRDLYRLSASHPGRRLVLVLNGAPVGARRIDGAIADGALFTFVEMRDGDLAGLAANLNRSTLALQRGLARR